MRFSHQLNAHQWELILDIIQQLPQLTQAPQRINSQNMQADVIWE
jgi:hypothetical protein